jgi:hypothetical protein
MSCYRNTSSVDVFVVVFVKVWVGEWDGYVAGQGVVGWGKNRFEDWVFELVFPEHEG